MSLRKMLSETCDIYRPKVESGTSYGIPSIHREETYTYETIPTYEKESCYFVESKTDSRTNEPGVDILSEGKIYFFPRADVQMNDRIYHHGYKRFYLVKVPPKRIKGRLLQARVILDEN